jgi:hypothetical protein
MMRGSPGVPVGAGVGGGGAAAGGGGGVGAGFGGAADNANSVVLRAPARTAISFSSVMNSSPEARTR